MIRPCHAGLIFTAVLFVASPAIAQQFGVGSVGVASEKNKKWVSVCPMGTTIVAGSCLLPEGTKAILESFGANTDNEGWEYVWSKSVPNANVRAYCSRTQ